MKNSILSDSVTAGLIATILAGSLSLVVLSSCDGEKSGGNSGRREEPGAGAAHGEKGNSNSHRRAALVTPNIAPDIKLQVRSSVPFSPELNSSLRQEFESVLQACKGDSDKAVEVWLRSYLDGMESSKVESTTYSLLRAITLQAFGAGGRYIEKNFKSAQSRRQALANWFDSGARFRTPELGILFKAINDPADSELYARRIGSTAGMTADTPLAESLLWLKQQVGDDYLSEAVGAYLDSGKSAAISGADRKALVNFLETTTNISPELKETLVNTWINGMESSDLVSSVEFLQRQGIKSDSSWIALVRKAEASDFDTLGQLRDAIPETCPSARQAIADAAVASNGVTADSLAFLTVGRMPAGSETLPYADHIVSSVAFEEAAGLVANIENREARELLVWQVVERALVLGGKDIKELEPFTRMVNDPGRLNQLVRQAELIRKMNMKVPGR